jgi:hypothetical protein
MANITARQKIVLQDKFLEGTGAENFNDKVNSTIETFLAELGNKFKDNWIETINAKKIIASGGIDKVEFVIDETDSNRVTLNILFPYYAKFVDKGVKGVKSSANAPDSPYQFKNYGMNAEGRASVKRWLDSGKAKVTATDVKRYGSVGTEKKFNKISEADSKLNTLIYNIKKYGIKKRDFINPVLNETLDGAAKELSDILGKEIVINIFQ